MLLDLILVEEIAMEIIERRCRQREGFMDLEDIRDSYSVNVDQPRKSGRSGKSGSSSAITDRRKPSSGNHNARTPALSKPLLPECIQNEREQLFKAISIVECCKYVSATLPEVESTEYMDGVFDVLCDLLNSAAGELGCIVAVVKMPFEYKWRATCANLSNSIRCTCAGYFCALVL